MASTGKRLTGQRANHRRGHDGGVWSRRREVWSEGRADIGRLSSRLLRSPALVVFVCLALGPAVHPQEHSEAELLAEAVRRGLRPVSQLHVLAEQGNADAQFRLGLMYADGKGVEEDATGAARWLRLAERQGHAQAQAELFNRATRWEAEQGDAKAQATLGFRYWFGLGGEEQDLVEAARWYRLAAEQGDAVAQYRLGWFYIVGDGVPHDFQEGIRWYRLAAENGSKQAIEDLERAWACYKPSGRNEVLLTLTWSDHEDPALRVGRVSVAGTSHVAGFSVNGLNLRWNFGDDAEGGYDYSFIIRPDGTGLYYDFSHSTGGTANASQTYKCEVAADRR